MRIFLCLLALLLGLAGCRKAAEKKSIRAKMDACDLIKAEEVEAIQGSPVKETKSSERFEVGLRVAQCFFSTADFTKSVVVTMWQSDPEKPAKQSPKEFWKERFGRYSRGNVERNQDRDERPRERGEEEERKSIPPKRIDGLGDEAYWTGSVGAALYVLKNDVFVRVAVGGSGSEETRIKNSKALAEKALGRL